MTVKLFNKQLGSTVNESLLAASSSAGASVVQCGWDYLYIGNNSQPISGGSLWKLDPATGVPITKVRTAHTIATGLPTSSNLASTNDFSEMVTSFHNGKLYMYIHFGTFNGNIVYRGVWNETNLRFEDFQPFVTFSNANLSGRYTTMINWGTSSIVLISDSGYYAQFNAINGSIDTQPTTFSGTWSPSSYTFNTGFYSNGYGIGASGNGVNWYYFTSASSTAFNPSSTTLCVQGFNYATSQLLRPSYFYPVIYFLNTNGDIKTMVANIDALFANPKWSYVTKSYKTSIPSSGKSINFPKYSDGKLNTAKVGNLIVKQDIDNVQQIDSATANNRWSADILVGKNYIYRVCSNMNFVEIWTKKPDGDFNTYVKTVSWYDMDNSRINEICRNSSSVPSAYAIVVSGNDDYLVGWSMDKAFIYSWKINNDGSITYSNSYTAPEVLQAYCRAGWDGGNYVYFYKYNTKVIFKWSIFTSTVTTVCTLDNNIGISSSWTGSGLLVKNGYIYIPQSANARGNYAALAVWRLSDGALQTKLPHWSLYGLYKTGSNTYTGGIQLTPLHNKAYIVSQQITQINTMNIEWDLNNFYLQNSHILHYEPEYNKEIKDVSKEYRTVGNKTITDVLQVIKLPQISDGVSNVLVGKTKIYLQETVSSNIHVFNKNIDGTIGAYIGIRDWKATDNLISSIIMNAPSAGTMYIDSSGVDHFIGFQRSINGNLSDWVINSDGSLGGRTDYVVDPGGTTTGVNTEKYIGAYKRAGWDGGNYIYVIGFIGDTNNTGLFRFNLSSKGNLEFISTIFSNYGTSSFTYSGLLVEDDYLYWSYGADGSGTYILSAYNRYANERQQFPLSYPENTLYGQGFTNQLGILYDENKSNFESDSVIGNISLSALHLNIGYGIYASNSGTGKDISKIVIFNIEKSQALSNPGVSYNKYTLGLGKDISDKQSALSIGFQDWSIIKSGALFRFNNSSGVGDGSNCMLGYGSDSYYNGKAGITNNYSAAFRFKAPIAGIYKFKVALRGGEYGRIYDVTNNKVLRYLYGSKVLDVYFNLSKDQQIDFIEDDSNTIGIFEVCIPQPTALSFTELSDGKVVVQSLSRMSISWSGSFDLENNDNITYDIELYNGSQWLPLGSTNETSYSPIIPSMNISNAKIRVRARSGQSRVYSQYIISNTFSIVPSSNQPPVYLTFDGIDDYIDFYEASFLPKGDFTIEFLFRTVYSDTMSLISFRQGLRIYIVDGKIGVINSGGTPNIISNNRYNDGLLHHIALVRSGSNLSLLIDGINVSTVANSSDFSGGYDGFTLGATTGAAQLLNGVITLPRFWNDVRTTNEIMTYKDTIVPDTEQGLVDYLIFEPSTGKIRAKKNTSLYGTIVGGVQWSFKFVPIDTEIPFPDDFQRKENLEHLRDKVNQLRTSNGLSPLIWTDPVIVKGYTPIRAVHWNEVEGGLNDVYLNTGEAITSPDVKDQLEEVIIPNNKNFPVKNLDKRMKNIIKGLKNK